MHGPEEIVRFISTIHDINRFSYVSVYNFRKIVSYFLFFSSFEKNLKGKTIGKMYSQTSWEKDKISYDFIESVNNIINMKFSWNKVENILHN